MVPELPEASQVPSYGEDYITWKRWGAVSFGALSSSTRKYFEAELRRAGVLREADLNVLEIGFGNGDFMAYCRSRNWRVTGVEINPDLVAIAQDTGYEARNLSDLDDIEEAHFHLVALIDVLEHIEQKNTIPFLQKLMSKLKPGGVLIAHFPNGDSPFGLYSQNGDPTHVNVIGTSKARHYGKAVGADILFLGAEARPIPSGALKYTLQRAIALPFHWALNKIARVIFLPGSGAEFAATALTMILRRRSAK